MRGRVRGRRRPRGMRAAEGREQQAKGVGVPRPGRRGGGFRCSWQSRRLERHLQEPFAEMREAPGSRCEGVSGGAKPPPTLPVSGISII